MKFLNWALAVLLPTSLATSAVAQTQPGPFSHIIIVVQENRTPDNIFGGGGAHRVGCSLQENPFQPGADIENSGFVQGQQGLVCNISQHMNLGAGFDPGHQYEDWSADYDSGHMDGFCHGYTFPNCPTYSYVQQSDVQPYFDIATTYGFANYMFQTNEGPSFEAHQILFTGTSAPVAPNDPRADYHWDFVKDNPIFTDSGCPITTGTPGWIQPDRTTVADPLSLECYTHDSLVTSSTCTIGGICDRGVSWQYYAPSSGVIWDAPGAIPEVCYGENDTLHAGSACGSVNGGAEWGHMSFYTGPLQGAPIFSDILNCRLQQISWVIPDEAWSDHPGASGPALGPSWVGDIVDAIGSSYVNSNHGCDYWGTNLPQGQAQPTAIFIVWDDWGGFYDHVSPPAYWTGTYLGNHNWSCPAPNQWGCGYTYGFRVPFLVVSQYTGTLSNGQYTGYISGPCGVAGVQPCPYPRSPYVHDFGSILAYTEYNFGLPFIDGPPEDGYADYNAPDWSTDHKTHVPLSDFFPLWAGTGSVGRPFVSISTPDSASFFQSYYTTHNATPTGPDTE